jgi:tetratricopeptide (TPR) repeat protein
MMLLPGLLFLCGCYSAEVGTQISDSKKSTDDPASSSTQADVAVPESQPKITSPAEIRNAQLKAAMRGLNYGSGLVEIDKKIQREVQRDVAGSADRLFETANALYEQNVSVDAIDNFTKAVLKDPTKADYYEGLGRALVAKGLIDEAVAAFRSALQRAPDFFEAQFQLAMARQMQGDQQQANEAWRDVLVIDNKNGEAHSRLAVGLYYTGDFQGAWSHVHAAEALGHQVPPQFRLLLAGKMAEPVK